MARLVPAPRQAAQPHEVIAAIRQARRGVALGDLSLRELISEGRR